MVGFFEMNATLVAPPGATVCSQSFMNSMKSDSTATLNLSCSATLSANDTLKRMILIQGAETNGLTLDCNGATINAGSGTALLIRARKYTLNGADAWSRPEDITIKNCHIMGQVVLTGLQGDGRPNDALYLSSRLDGNHTARAQAAAPTRVTFDHVSVTAQGEIPIYLQSGVTYFTLQNSTLNGNSNGPGMYLDSESAFNVLKNNIFQVATGNREQIAIDGSAHNTITGNFISGLDNGGIFLYRNCGERGMIRHQTPSYNVIINNFFDYQNYHGSNPAINVASRNGNRRYCGDDNGFPWGSSANNNDLARNNVVAENQMRQRSPSDSISVNDSPNLIIDNQYVNERITRGSSCYYQPANQILADGETIVLLTAEGAACRALPVICHDGTTTFGATTTCPQRTVVPFMCQVSSNNNGCSQSVSCPAGKKIVNAKAACNLEFGGVPELPPWNYLSVYVKSDITSDGHCVVDGKDIAAGQTLLSSPKGKNSISVSCREHDNNGGDCVIRGAIDCE